MTQVRVLTPGRPVRDRAVDLAIGVLAGFTLAVGLTTLCHDQQIRELQSYSREVTTSAAAIVARALHHADSLKREADSLAGARQPIIVEARTDNTLADKLELSLADQKTTADSNVVLRAQVRALHRVSLNLWRALANAEAQVGVERQRGDSLAKVVTVLHADIQGLNARIQRLRGSSCGAHATAGIGVRGLDAVIGFGCAVPLPRIRL